MKAYELAWLDYAWSVVGCGPEHSQRCEAAGGMGMPGGTMARFPGFVGPDYEPGRGVVCIGHIHRYLPDVDDLEGGRLEEIEAAIVGWRQRGRGLESDVAFLAESRAAYLASAPGWRYWKRHYAPLLDDARIPVEEVAFANVAKCRTATEIESGASVRLAKMCAQVYPPAGLVRLLQPAAVLLASLQLDVGDVGDVRVIRWNGRTGVDETGLMMKNWLPAEGGRLRRLRS